MTPLESHLFVWPFVAGVATVLTVMIAVAVEASTRPDTSDDDTDDAYLTDPRECRHVYRTAGTNTDGERCADCGGEICPNCEGYGAPEHRGRGHNQGFCPDCPEACERCEGTGVLVGEMGAMVRA